QRPLEPAPARERRRPGGPAGRRRRRERRGALRARGGRPAPGLAVGKRPALRRVPVRGRRAPGADLHEGDVTGWEQSAVTIAVFLPAAGALVIALTPRSRPNLARALGVLVTGAALGVGVAILFGFDYGSGSGLQFELSTRWIRAIGAGYHVGLDGISLPLFELTLLTTFLCAVYTLHRMPEGGSP